MNSYDEMNQDEQLQEKIAAMQRHIERKKLRLKHSGKDEELETALRNARKVLAHLQNPAAQEQLDHNDIDLHALRYSLSEKEASG